MPPLPIKRVVLYKHGIGYFEREAVVEGDDTLTLSFRQAEVSDVLKSLTVLDLDGGVVSSVSYSSTQPLAQLLADIDLAIPDQNSLLGLLPQLRGARLAVVVPGEGGSARVEGAILGIDVVEKVTPEGRSKANLLSLLCEDGQMRSFDLQEVLRLELLDPSLRRDLEAYLAAQLSSRKKDARTFTFFAQGPGRRTIRLSYTLEAPVWKATYRVLLGEEGRPPMLQGWAVVDNTQEESWENVELSLVAGLPVSFIHDLYTPRYLRRPVVAVAETTGVLPPEVEYGMAMAAAAPPVAVVAEVMAAPAADSKSIQSRLRRVRGGTGGGVSSTPAQVRERKLGDLFEYAIEHPVTIRGRQSALVPIVLRGFEGRTVLLHNRNTRRENPLRCVEMKNTTGLTLEGGPVTVLEAGSYVGEAMLETTKPDEQRILPYAVELGVGVLDNVDGGWQEVHRVTIREGTLTTWRMQTETTTYHFHNKGAEEYLLYLDHPRRDEAWQVSRPEPVETTQGYWRFRLTLPPGQTVAVRVEAHQPLEHTQALVALDAKQLGFWASQRHLDDPTRQTLRAILQTQEQVAALERRIEALEKEREAIHQEQHRLRENLNSLGDRPSEKELRERFVRTLGAQEDRLEGIASDLRQQSAQREEARAALSQQIAALHFEEGQSPG